MFTTSDEIFVWTKKRNNNRVYKLKTSASVKQRFVEVFNNGISALMASDGEKRECISYESNYNVSKEEENFIIASFVVPQELKDAIDYPDVVENYIPKDKTGKTEDGYGIRAIIMGSKNNAVYCFAGQKFSQRQIVIKPRGFNLFFQQDMFVADEREFSISIRDDIDCFYEGEGLIFEKYIDANGVFDLSEYYRTASQKEVDEFSSNSVFAIEDANKFANSVAGISMRKKIAKIIDLGTLNDVAKIKTNAQRVNIDIEFTDNDRLRIPNDKKKLKKVLAFLAEELYPGLFTNNTYLTNSTRKVD